ncbi:DUF2835 domain-containing protein [Parathalassolituus penaei]|uniref:DUF2835 domain-containing protein n=1 Tax=Parathalassolituus penaei TaxID=2997323 RepID=A0A9X3EGX5_9GAMM|nr:DUF2835 domain-containing protein [Parathalassolituus penaei]MCY0966505.1 DUF2835 domain-containing protein [Parathalassolituus penaei]
MNQRVVLDIYLSAAELQRYYSGDARMVQGRALDGRSVRFPANLLRPMVTREGVNGRFVIEFDAQGKFQSIARLPRV